MAQLCSIVPRSGGKILESEDHVFGLLRDSSSCLANPSELRNRLISEGYLYLKHFFPREDILRVRNGILARMREQDLLLPSSNSLDATANLNRRTAFMPELAQNNSSLLELIYGERVTAFYEKLLGGPILHYDFTWFRPVGPGHLVKRLGGASCKEFRYWSQPSAYSSETWSNPAPSEALAVSSAADSAAAKPSASVRCRMPQSPVKGNRPVCTTVPFGAEL